MSPKVKPSSRKAARHAPEPTLADSTSKPPLTVEEHVDRIEAIGKRIDGYVQFMCKIATQPGVSSEAKERALRAFYKQMLSVESQLGRIHDEVRLE